MFIIYRKWLKKSFDLRKGIFKDLERLTMRPKYLHLSWTNLLQCMQSFDYYGDLRILHCILHTNTLILKFCPLLILILDPNIRRRIPFSNTHYIKIMLLRYLKKKEQQSLSICLFVDQIIGFWEPWVLASPCLLSYAS